MVDWTAHYDTIYASLGVAATLEFGESTDPDTVSLTVIDKTAGVEVSIGGNVSMPTIKPACAVRAHELTDKSVALDDLKNGLITFNDETWRIEGKMFKPGPAGERHGEIYLLLIEARE